MDFKTLYYNYAEHTEVVQFSLIGFLDYCKVHTTLTAEDHRNKITQIYKKGPECSSKKKKQQISDRIKENFDVSF